MGEIWPICFVPTNFDQLWAYLKAVEWFTKDPAIHENKFYVTYAVEKIRDYKTTGWMIIELMS